MIHCLAEFQLLDVAVCCGRLVILFRVDAYREAINRREIDPPQASQVK